MRNTRTNTDMDTGMDTGMGTGTTPIRINGRKEGVVDSSQGFVRNHSST